MNILNSFLELIYPPLCLCCQKRLAARTEYICSCCLLNFPVISKACPRCALSLGESDECEYCHGLNFSFSGVCALGEYKHDLRDIIHRLKYKSKSNLAAGLAKMLVQKVEKKNWPELNMITSIPLHRSSYLKRGYNQAELLANNMAKLLGIEYQQMLKKVKKTSSQSFLSREERAENLIDVFEYRGKKAKGNILLVDDVFTTGSTVEEAAKVLLNKGAEKVYVAVVAR